VVVERVLPNGLKIRVTEREPIAQVLLPRSRPVGGAYGGGHYTLDVQGYFMFPIEAPQRTTPATGTNDSLPLLTGIPPQDIRPGRAADSPQVRAALALVQAFQSSPMAGVVDLKQVAVNVPGVLVVTTAQGNEVSFGLQEFPAQFQRWRLVHDHAQRFGKYVVSLDLAVANHSPLIWTDVAGMTPPPPPKPVKASPYKKKHV
jgi:cell division septal protein FtsQ